MTWPEAGAVRPLRIGVLGCADIALRRMLPAMSAARGAELVAVASRDSKKAVEVAQKFGCRPADDYAALLGLAEVEAVYIPLPLALHEEWVRSSLRAGKHVLVEKPVTTSGDRTAALISLARDLGLVLMENIMFIHHSQHAAVHKLISAGEIGEVRTFHAAFAVPRLPPENIRYRADLGGGALWDTGVYPLRAAMHFLGTGLEVAGAVITAPEGRQVDTCGSALLRSPDGAGAHITFGLEQSYRSRYEIWGSQGCVTVDRAFTPPAGHRPVLLLERAGNATEIHLEPDDQVGNTVAAFAAAVRAGAPVSPLCLQQACLLDDIRRCAGGGPFPPG